MAKIDSQASRATAFAEEDQDELMGQFYRPAAPASGRAQKTQETASERPPRKPRKTAGDGQDRDDDAFLRARRRVPVRRGLIPSTRNGRIAAAAIAVAAIALLAWLGVEVRNFFRDDSRFRIASSSSIQIMGNSQVTRPELLSVFGSDLGRNVFFIPLAARRTALEQLPWVEHAAVMRFLPDQLRVSIVERTPVAFVRQGNTVGLIDAHGVLLRMSPAAMSAKHYSFPVVTGITAKDSLPVRAARMKLYQQFIHDLDSGGSKISNQLSEVDLSDSEDVSALLPAEGSDIQVHFGDSDFLERYRSYQQHLPEWRQQYPHLTSVDMRYENQVVLDMAQPGAAESQGHHAAAEQKKPAAGHLATRPAAKPVTKAATKPAAKPTAKPHKAGRAKG